MYLTGSALVAALGVWLYPAGWQDIAFATTTPSTLAMVVFSYTSGICSLALLTRSVEREGSLPWRWLPPPARNLAVRTAAAALVLAIAIPVWGHRDVTGVWSGMVVLLACLGLLWCTRSKLLEVVPPGDGDTTPHRPDGSRG